MKARFNDQYTPLQREVINRLAEIEKEDADACAGCGGEDCICCEIYHDRQKWVGPDELFADDDLFGIGEYRTCDGCGHEYRVDRVKWCEECDCCEVCCTCEEETEVAS